MNAPSAARKAAVLQMFISSAEKSTKRESHFEIVAIPIQTSEEETTSKRDQFPFLYFSFPSSFHSFLNQQITFGNSQVGFHFFSSSFSSSPSSSSSSFEDPKSLELKPRR